MINNVKGIVFTAIGSLVGLLVSKKVTDELNDHFNPELQEEKDQMKETLLLALREPFKTGEDAEHNDGDNIVDVSESTDVTVEEGSE